jgi:hypothetical protein
LAFKLFLKGQPKGYVIEKQNVHQAHGEVAHYSLHKRNQTWIYIKYLKYYIDFKFIYSIFFLKLGLVELSLENKIS